MARYRIDYESRSACDIRKLGGWRYADDESTEITLCAIARDDEPVQIWDRFAGPGANELALMLLEDCSDDPDAEVWAFNAGGFEVPMSIAHWQKTFGCPMPALERWRCSAVMVRVASAPGSLAKAAEFFGLPVQKDKAGGVLIRTFCVPQKVRGSDATFWLDPIADAAKKITVAGEKLTVAQAWQKFRQYCIQDVETERELGKKLTRLEIKGDLLKAFTIDLKMNARGIPVNVPGVIEAEKIVDKYNADLAVRFRELTGLNPNQGQAVLQWLQDRGYPGQDLRAPTVAAILQEDVDPEEDEEADDAALPTGTGNMTPEAIEALKMRAMLSFAAIKKLPTMRNAACRDGRVRGAIMFYGAHTGRASGKIIQIQNFKRPILGYKPCGEPQGHDVYRLICSGNADAELLEQCFGASPLACIASSIRHWIDPGEGKEFLDIDLANIEARVLAWLAGDENRLNNFRKGVDLYKVQAAAMFGISYDAVNKEQRQQAKVAELSLGYGGGKAAFQAMAGNYGLHLPEEQIVEIVKLYRKSNPEITAFWKSTQQAAVDAVETRNKWFHAGPHIKLGTRHKLGYKELVAMLPSGRRLHYPLPQTQLVYKRRNHAEDEWVNISEDQAFDSNKKKRDGVWATHEFSYYGQTKGVNYGRVRTFGGSLVENWCQSVAADFLNHGTIQLEENGYLATFQVHDQVVCPYEPEKGQTPEKMREIMCRLPKWAQDFPLEAEAGRVPFYSK